MFFGLLSATGVALQIRHRPQNSIALWVLPKRWIMQRSFAWMGNNRRLSKDNEVTDKSSQIFVCIAFIRLMLARVDKL